MAASEIKRAAAYIRVSTEEQVEYSPDAQLAEIQKYAAAHGFVVPENFVFIDEGISGKETAKRRGFKYMIGTAKQKPKPFDAILLWKFSRFARNREDSIVYKSMLRRELGIEVISITEPLADDKMSILMEAMIEAMDEYYSINLAEEVRRGMTEKARRGGLQAPPSFGYAVKENQLVPIPEEAALVRAMFERFLSGEGLFPIAKWLNELGIRTHRGNPFENRTVEYILRNPVYVGKLRWNPSGRTRRDFDNANIILADAGHEPILPIAVWETAQCRMAELKALRRVHGRPQTEHKDWISGLVRCADCGCTLVFSKPHYWKCNGYVRGSCKSTQHIADKKLKSMLLSGLAHDSQTTAITCTAPRPRTNSLDENALVQDQLKRSAVKLARLREAYLSGTESLESYTAVKSDLEAQCAVLRQHLAAQTAPQDQAADSLSFARDAGSCLAVLKNPDIDILTKHNAIHSIVETCVFSRDSNFIQLTYRLL